MKWYWLKRACTNDLIQIKTQKQNIQRKRKYARAYIQEKDSIVLQKKKKGKIYSNV